MRNYKLKTWQIIILIIIISIITELFSVFLQPGNFCQSIYNIITRPLTIFLNIFPILVLITLGYFIIGNVFWSASIMSFFSLILSYVNLLKIEGREDAFVPADIGLFREGVASFLNYNLDIHLDLVVLIVFYCLMLFFLGCYIKSSKLKLYIRSIFSIIVVITFTFVLKNVYFDKKIYNSFSVPEMYNIPSVFNTLGFNYCFLYNLNLYPVDKPDRYDSLEVEEWEEYYLEEKKSPSIKPNIIMIMGEAFSDISNEDVFNWNDETENPTYKYNLLVERENSIAGHIIVPNILAGTANTEFDVLTGLPSTMIGDTTTSSFRVVHRTIPTIASLLKREGYKTTFLHPGDSWFYNRSSVYSYFGIENKIFKEAFNLGETTQDALVYDSEFYRVLKEEIEKKESPQFITGVTIQNHQAYFYFKYYDETDAVPLKKEVSEQSLEKISVYLRGVNDTTNMIYELAEYIDTLPEPTILVFYGDHLPNLGNDYLGYSELELPIGKTDTVENILSSYKVPFLIYYNEVYSNLVDLKIIKDKLELPKNNIINSNYLGAMLLEMIDYIGYDAYFDYLNSARKILPVFRVKENVYMFPDGTYKNKIEGSFYNDIIKKIDWWEYYRLKN